MTQDRQSTRAISATVVVPNWNGRRWLSGCLDAIAAQTVLPVETIVVDNGSTDGSRELIRSVYPWVRLLALDHNTGFAFAANRGVELATTNAVALVNTDVLLSEDWLERMLAVLERHSEAASVACKMLDLRDPVRLYDAGDFLRRDGAAEQRGRFTEDDGRYDDPCEVFSACAGAALYRRGAFLAEGGFEERFVVYLEDLELGLRLRLAGWTCRYESAVALHASEGSSGALDPPPATWIERNTLLLVARFFPVGWLPQVVYRQIAVAWRAFRARRLRAHLRGVGAALPLLPATLRGRSQARRRAVVPIDEIIPACSLWRPIADRDRGAGPQPVPR